MVPESYVNWRAFEYKFQDNPLCINVEYIRNDNLTMQYKIQCYIVH